MLKSLLEFAAACSPVCAGVCPCLAVGNDGGAFAGSAFVSDGALVAGWAGGFADEAGAVWENPMAIAIGKNKIDNARLRFINLHLSLLLQELDFLSRYRCCLFRAPFRVDPDLLYLRTQIICVPSYLRTQARYAITCPAPSRTCSTRSTVTGPVMGLSTSRKLTRTMPSSWASTADAST